jgi:dihydropteroate synthase
VATGRGGVGRWRQAVTGVREEYHRELAHAHKLRAHGAGVIELGADASHPGSAPVSAAQERRLVPVLEQPATDGIVPVSVNSFRPGSLRFATSGGAVYLYDIHGSVTAGTWLGG